MKTIMVLVLLMSSQSFAQGAIEVTGQRVASRSSTATPAELKPLPFKRGRKKPANKSPVAKAPAQPSPEVIELKTQIEDLKKQVSDIQTRLATLELKDAAATAAAVVVSESAPPAAPPEAAVTNEAADKQGQPNVYEGRHVSYEDGFWMFETAGYTLRCESACPGLQDINAAEPLTVHAKEGKVEFKTKLSARTCQVSQCAAVR
jgi:hypothetical protein